MVKRHYTINIKPGHWFDITLTDGRATQVIECCKIPLYDDKAKKMIDLALKKADVDNYIRTQQ